MIIKPESQCLTECFPVFPARKTHTMAAYLIAQPGKNYANDANMKITGKALVELAWTVIEDAQYMLGGMVVFLETENEEKLL